MEDRKPWSFCETPEEKCTMNYCDENGCQNRKRNYVEGNDFIADVVGLNEQLPPNQITDKEHKKLMKVLYPKDNSKRFMR